VLSSSQTLRTTQLKHVTRAFKLYKQNRSPPTRKAWLLSKALAKVYSHDTATSNNSHAKGKGEGMMKGRGVNLLRKVVGKVPAWAWKKVFERLLVDDVKLIKGSGNSNKAAAVALPGGAPSNTEGSHRGDGGNSARNSMSHADMRARKEVKDVRDDEEEEEALSPEEQEAVEEAVTALVSGGGSVEEEEEDEDEDDGESKDLTSSTLSLSSLSLSTSSRNGAAVV
ncbi:hypothetical protein BGZ95_007678, partial [Linnemannia exigua]